MEIGIFSSLSFCFVFIGVLLTALAPNCLVLKVARLELKGSHHLWTLCVGEFLLFRDRLWLCFWKLSRGQSREVWEFCSDCFYTHKTKCLNWEVCPRDCVKKRSSPAGIFLQCCAVFSAVQAGAFHLPGYFFFLDQAQWRPDRLSRLICSTVTWDQTWVSCSQHVRYPLHHWCHTECPDENRCVGHDDGLWSGVLLLQLCLGTDFRSWVGLKVKGQ